VAFWNRRAEKRSLDRQNVAPLLVRSASFGASISPANAMKVGDVFAAVRVLADSVSSLPLHTYRKVGESRQRVTGGSLYDLLENPAPATTQSDFLSLTMVHLCAYGNCYLGKYREDGAIVQLSPLDPERVQVEIRNGQPVYRYSPPQGVQQMLTTEDVCHIRALSLDGILGVSPVQQAARVLNLSDQLVRHAINYFDSGSVHPSGILTMPEGSSFEAESRETERLRNEAKPHGVLVVQGEADFTQMSVPMDDQQFAQQREISAREVARVFRIPPHMLGASTGDSLTYSTVEQQSLDFLRFSLQPWLRRIELAISNDPDLAFQRQYVRFETGSFLRSDAKTRAEFYEKALASGWMDVNEVRQLEDLEPTQSVPETTGPADVVPTNGNQPAMTRSESRGALIDVDDIPQEARWILAGFTQKEMDQMRAMQLAEQLTEEDEEDLPGDAREVEAPTEVATSNGNRED
jgi:HK97 family phage portal protein